MELQNLFKEYEQIPLYVKKCTLFTLYFRLYLHSVSKENSSMTQILDHHQCQPKVWKIGGVSSHTRSFCGKGFASFSAKNLVCICTPRHPISAGPDHNSHEIVVQDIPDCVFQGRRRKKDPSNYQQLESIRKVWNVLKVA